MAKQTFTTGQVLTAAQMTSLQQTAMGGGSATAKTASYVLVAADAGTTVIMNAAGSTTITVNTSLFAAGDTVLIQNIGAGACTVTPGSATVSTAGSLALTQYEAGILYFTATGTALFHDYVQAASNPLTTTGDMIYSSSGSTQARLGIGSSAQVLTVASGIPSWATPSSGGQTLLSTTSLSGSSTTISSISSAYKHLNIFVRNMYVGTGNPTVRIQLNGDTGSNYSWLWFRGITGGTSGVGGSASDTNAQIGDSSSSTTYSQVFNADITIPRYAESDKKVFFANTNYYIVEYYIQTNRTAWNSTAAINSITFSLSSSSFSGGTVYIYGVN